MYEFVVMEVAPVNRPAARSVALLRGTSFELWLEMNHTRTPAWVELVYGTPPTSH